jgi:hypothetical protein
MFSEHKEVVSGDGDDDEVVSGDDRCPNSRHRTFSSSHRVCLKQGSDIYQSKKSKSKSSASEEEDNNCANDHDQEGEETYGYSESYLADSSCNKTEWRCLLVEEENDVGLSSSLSPNGSNKKRRDELSKEERMMNSLPNLHIPTSINESSSNHLVDNTTGSGTTSSQIRSHHNASGSGSGGSGGKVGVMFANVVILDVTVWNDANNEVVWSFSVPKALKLKQSSSSSLSSSSSTAACSFMLLHEDSQFGWIMINLVDLPSTKQVAVDSVVISLLI